MSTTDLRPTPSEQREPESAPKPKIDLSVTQVAGGALAAMTAAFLGSRLSVAGTVVGAALASVVAAVASNLYTASLRTTREKVRTVFRGRDAGTGAPVVEGSADDTFTWSDGQPAASTPTPPQPKRQLRWQSVVLGAVAAFALAFAVLTGLELASGQSLSGGNGTTITQVAEHKPAADPTTEPSSGASDSPTPKASDSPTAAEPSATASSEPTAEPSATEPTPTETPSATATPSSESSATAAPETGDEPGTADQGTG